MLSRELGRKQHNITGDRQTGLLGFEPWNSEEEAGQEKPPIIFRILLSEKCLALFEQWAGLLLNTRTLGDLNYCNRSSRPAKIRLWRWSNRHLKIIISTSLGKISGFPFYSFLLPHQKVPMFNKVKSQRQYLPYSFPTGLCSQKLPHLAKWLATSLCVPPTGYNCKLLRTGT